MQLIRKDNINGLIFHPGAASGLDTRRQRCFLGIKTKVLSSVWKQTLGTGSSLFTDRMVKGKANSSPLFPESAKPALKKRCPISLLITSLFGHRLVLIAPFRNVIVGELLTLRTL